MSTTPILAGHRSLIVGGGSGIGYATAELLLAAGATVTIAGRNTDKLQTAAAQLRSIAAAAGGDVLWAGCDVMNGADVRKAVEVAEGGIRLDSAVTVPGGGHFRPVLGYTDDLFSDEVDQNVRPQYLVLKYAGLAMVRCGGGSIIAVSSTAAQFSSRYLASYCAGKAAVEHLVRVAADELGEKNIRVNAVGPGLTRTDATEGMFANAALVERFLAQQPLRRAGAALDQAQAIRFLAGPESSWITGQCLTVDGGNTLRSFPDCKDMAQSILGPEIFAATDRGEVV